MGIPGLTARSKSAGSTGAEKTAPDTGSPLPILRPYFGAIPSSAGLARSETSAQCAPFSCGEWAAIHSMFSSFRSRGSRSAAPREHLGDGIGTVRQLHFKPQWTWSCVIRRRCTKVAAPRPVGCRHPGTLVEVTSLFDTTAAAICLAEYLVEAKNYFHRRRS